MIFTNDAPEHFTGSELIDVIHQLPNQDGIEMIHPDDHFELAGGNEIYGYTYIADSGDTRVYAHIEVDDEGIAIDVRLSTD